MGSRVQSNDEPSGYRALIMSLVIMSFCNANMACRGGVVGASSLGTDCIGKGDVFAADPTCDTVSPK